MSIPLSNRGASDRRIWNASARGVFSVKSAYALECTLQKRNEGGKSFSGAANRQWKRIWDLKDNTCPVCLSEPETVVHVCWGCSATADVWGRISVFRKWRRDFYDFQALWEEMGTKLKQEELELAATVMHSIWLRRNEMVFNGNFQSPNAVIAKAQADYSVNREVQEGVPGAAVRILGSESRQFDKDRGRMGIGVVVRDSEGALIGSLVAPKRNVTSAFQAEGHALHRAMVFCIELGLMHVCFEGDAKAVVDAVNSETEDNSWDGQLIEDIRQLKAAYLVWKLGFVRRSVNASAHVAAKLAVFFSCESVWLEDGPSEVRKSIMDELVCNELIQS
ncbi:uncharacterized protein LOC122301713 [Carya illinoinensis]|uniref:uncharacterized protein LOC122301713 n=1 Tax=Carya illinoinensis TaxID=32201 RepID=UPI001C718C4C|nr:uncharacterized protein LOC122301713 [Carya illinoinensis]